MTTEEAFEKLISIKCWHKLAGISSSQASTQKHLYASGRMGLSAMCNILTSAQAVLKVVIIFPNGKTYDNFLSAFDYFVRSEYSIEYKKKNKGIYDYKNKIKTNTIQISTMYNYLTSSGCAITMDWQMPDLQEMSSQVKTIDSVFTSGITHCAITNTNTFFKEFIETVGWYKRNPHMYPQKAQHVKKKYYNNLLCLDEITNILIDSGCIYDLKITSPDGGAYFSDYATAYDILSKIYNINKTLEIDNLESHMVKEGGDKRLRIDVILQYLIKIGCDIDIKWELPELVEV